MIRSNSPQVVLVTGAGQGIGKGIAKRLVAEGMNVVVADIDMEAANESAAELGSQGVAVRVDVSEESSVKELMQLIRSRYGHLNSLVNNAGITKSIQGPVEQLELAEWNRIIATNLSGIFLCSKHAIPLLRCVKGSIVNIASTRALQSETSTEAYSASKGGVVALTHALAVSLGPDIRVNCVSPGWIAVDEWRKKKTRKTSALTSNDHGQHVVGRVGCPEDVAAMVSYLISSQAGFVTGQNFVVDGGMTRKMVYIDG
jgi:NAD(P)-dependent dehydrogenase (short-subunit alcohol dehydrogenase family)